MPIRVDILTARIKQWSIAILSYLCCLIELQVPPFWTVIVLVVFIISTNVKKSAQLQVAYQTCMHYYLDTNHIHTQAQVLLGMPRDMNYQRIQPIDQKEGSNPNQQAVDHQDPIHIHPYKWTGPVLGPGLVGRNHGTCHPLFLGCQYYLGLNGFIWWSRQTI